MAEYYTAYSGTSATATITGYDYSTIYNDPYAYRGEPVSAAKRKLSFEEEMQEEVDDWLSIFKEK